MKMLLRPMPSFRAARAFRAATPRPAPFTSRPFRAGSAPRINYTPPQNPYTHPPPKPWRHRICDMAIGSALTFAGYFGYVYWEYRQMSQEMAELEEMQKEDMRFKELIREARATGNEDALRDLTFQRQRHVTKSFPHDTVSEFGPLPSYPLGDDNCGKDLVPESDTLVIIEKDPDTKQISTVLIAANLHVEHMETPRAGGVVVDPSGTMPPFINKREPGYEPQDERLEELFKRFEYQAHFWVRRGELNEHGECAVAFALQDADKIFLFTFRDGFRTLQLPHQFMPMEE
ncbi:hypothetical protein PG999_003469 [Apiospora kogelbergensis]|uniref:Uncharacterized protein n=1 Tax=Apiospora kogelbergensis TaxID=1337665 RepID=A0AAW0R3S2_9PEZI